ncbi:glycosyltransferase [Metapseudomonas resinovorans]|uniref:glycosyltransferase n=1 Tax=Metapseudomonas resinovorans TaxID=53412 RepID=UPI00048C4396|nr:glycosyltransferase [Pseudomonas resinovorans]
MKVLHVCDAIDPSVGGGVAERTFQLAKALVRANVSCMVLATDAGVSKTRIDELRGVELVLVGSLFRRFYVPRISLSKMQDLVSRVDVVHITGHWSLLGTVVARVSRKLGKPYVYCPAGSLRIFGRSAFLKKIFNQVIGYETVAKAARCLAVTALEREHFHEYGIDDSRIVLVPNGVNPVEAKEADASRFLERHGFDRDAMVLLFLGRLSPIKGPDILLEAFSRIANRFPEAHLVFAGSDDELGCGLKAEVKGGALAQRIHFVGFLSGLDKQDALSAADLLIVPSRQEAMSLVALEAGLVGTPVLLTDQCGFNEVQEIGGGHVSSVDADSLARSLAELIADRNELQKMGQRLRNLVLERYTWDGLTKDCLDLYDEIVVAHK